VNYPVTLGPGECFVLADKRDEGADSRFFGPVKREEIQGSVITIMRRNNL
jgi:signal peptidase I